MLRYYSYYSIGGYKDLFLGSSEMMESYTYYLPLLAIQRKKAETAEDKGALDKVSALDALPKIKLVNKTNNYGLPSCASKLISHGGYKLIFTHAEEETYILTLRDIKGENKDESGRSVPFLVMIVGDSMDDARKLASIAAYWSNHMDTVTDEISKMFTYDPLANGTRFNIKEFNSLIHQSAYKQTGIETTDEKIIIPIKPNTVGALLLLPGISDKLIIEELGLQNKDVNFIPFAKVLPKDDPDKCEIMLMRARLERNIQKWKKRIFIAIGIIVIGIIVCVISKLTR